MKVSLKIGSHSSQTKLEITVVVYLVWQACWKGRTDAVPNVPAKFVVALVIVIPLIVAVGPTNVKTAPAEVTVTFSSANNVAACVVTNAAAVAVKLVAYVAK